ncbi:phosphoglycerate dehydrogenase [Staphylococcus croceilyticus]|uniref:D-3-phosphoglycerate dehydrogenase n=1 Tax=Staphylococcus croceilyticus TaxID=319942 RepID=A0ABY2KEF0_9STAP|nr:phosphoglycerate dehydrogenase [Staphylococcus croceilyticus]PNZ71061.1 phosphoglycerate dehydrogenase [Staphylococcus croceilyticus]TGA80173.1 phosphoglycerate dehydrogenase [Staphylococcus croceilyticus]
MTHKILVSDPISEEGLHSLLSHPDFEVDIKTDLTPEQLVDIIPQYEGLIVRSQTQVTLDVINKAQQLKVIARAGVGVDNIDIEAATLKGILVVNAPDGNTISATEHSVAMILAMARNIPQAHASLKSKEWNRKAFKGVELYQKTLGVIGAGRIGLGVAKRLQSFGMKILAFDPYLTEEKAQQLDIQLATVDEIATNADFVTVHTPLTPKTRGIINANFFAKAKPSLQIINVARGGIINEQDLLNALDNNQIAHAALDVFEHEPPTSSPLLDHDKIIITPHLGASTVEAQEKVAISVANEMIDILENGNVTNAVNAPKLNLNNIDEVTQQWIEVGELSGELAIQLLEEVPREIKITFNGEVSEKDTDLIIHSIVTRILQQDLGERVNLINAMALLKEQGVTHHIENRASQGTFSNYIQIHLIGEQEEVKIGATVVSGFGPRIVRINDYSVDFKPNAYQFISYHADKPGMVGLTGQLLGKHDINIASMSLGRHSEGGQAMMVLSVDQPVTQEVINELYQAGGFEKIYGTTLSVK